MADNRGVEKNAKILSDKKETEIAQNTHTKRPICGRCKRPKKVCLCEAFPDKPFEIATTVYILQHPEEVHRTLTTVPLLSACLPENKCIVYNDVRYSHEKYPALHEMLKHPQTLVLYPDRNATDLREIVKESSLFQKYNLVVPDGTWRQARSIFRKNDVLQQARTVQLKEKTKSHYIIRTQPTRNSLSTLEAVAVALSILEGRDEITEVLRKPLQLLCDIQIQHGAVPHSSKEEKKEQETMEQNKEKLISEQGTKSDVGKNESDIMQEDNPDGQEQLKQKQNETNGNKNRDQREEHETKLSPKRSKLGE